MVRNLTSLPHSIEAEENLLSCCFLDGNEVVARCVEAGITRDSFYDSKHGAIFAVMADLLNTNKPIELSVVAEELKAAKILDAVGGFAFLTQISNHAPTTAQATYFIEKVKEQSILREVIRASTETVESCQNYKGGLDELLDTFEKRMFGITQKHVADKTRHCAPVVANAMSVIDSMFENNGKMTGIKSGFIELDRLTWGFQRADVIIVAARPGMGKTSIALNIAETASTGSDKAAVLIFSLEMTATQLMQRMILSRAKVNTKLLRDGLVKRNSEEQRRLGYAAKELAAAPIFVDDSTGLKVSHIRARSRRLHSRNPLGLIIVDYLQLLAPSSKDVSREQQVAEASRGLKALAKELNVPVMVLSQLNRLADRESRTPKLSDLRESGAIEQDADVVLLMSKPQSEDDKFQVAGDVVEVYVAKQRNGPVGQVKLTFLRDITRFENHHD